MLILTVVKNDYIDIDVEDVTFRVYFLGLQNDNRNRVRLGIDAPKSVNVRRSIHTAGRRTPMQLDTQLKSRIKGI